MGESGQEPRWIDVLGQAVVEVSSEDELFPITAALDHRLTNGWRAATTGPQTVRLLFQEPQRLTRLRLHVVDRVSERTQEARVRAGAAIDALPEVACWEFSFSPRGNTEEVEEMELSLSGVTIVELQLSPDVRHPADVDDTYAVLKSFWLG